MQFTVGNRSTFAATGGKTFDAGRPTVVFVHGAGMNRTVWALQTRYFAHHGYNVVAVDLPGHGRTDGPALQSVDAMSEWLVAMLDALDIEAAGVVGHSLGSLVAFNTAARWPARVTALAMIGTSVPMAVTDVLLDAAEQNDQSAFDMVTVWGHSYDGQTGSNRAPGIWMTGGAVRILERSPSGSLHASLKAANEYRHGLELAPKVACKTLLLLGDRDMMTPAKAVKPLAEAISNVQVVNLAGCGHMHMAEQPDAVLDALIAFLK